VPGFGPGANDRKCLWIIAHTIATIGKTLSSLTLTFAVEVTALVGNPIGSGFAPLVTACLYQQSGTMAVSNPYQGTGMKQHPRSRYVYGIYFA